MARYIHCPECRDKYIALARKHEEWYEYLNGIALKNMLCDSCGIQIKTTDDCCAAMLLDNVHNKNAEYQHPAIWSEEFIT